MTLRISGKSINVGEALRGRVTERTEEVLRKYFDGNYSGHITLSKDGFGFRTDCALHLDSGITLEAESNAADAYANVLRLAPPTADAIADYGEMLVFANEGMVTAEAEGAFVEALKLEETNERAKYYYDMALKQEGKAPTLSDEQIAAVQAMPAQDQTAMIAGMMDGLEQKLGKDSRDLEGWKRLIRARRIS